MNAIEELLSKYIKYTDRVFTEIRMSDESTQIDKEEASHIIDTAKRYLEDAKYYLEEKKFETGLVSVAYSEGLLDALRLLNIADFKWPQ